MCTAPSDPFYSGSTVYAGVPCPDGRNPELGGADEGRNLSVGQDPGDVLYFIYCGPAIDAGQKIREIYPVFYGTSADLYAVHAAFFVLAGKPGDDRRFFAALQ